MLGDYLISLSGITRPKVRNAEIKKEAISKSGKVLLVCNPVHLSRRQNTVDLINAFDLLQSDAFEVVRAFPDKHGHVTLDQTDYDCVVILYDVLELRTTPWWHNFVRSMIKLRKCQTSCRYAILTQDDYTGSALLDHFMCCMNPEVVFSGSIDHVDVLYPRFTEIAGVFRACLTAYPPRDEFGEHHSSWVSFSNRKWDIGTRVRYLDGIFGDRGREKGRQAEEIKRKANSFGLTTDISTDPSDALMGPKWNEFLSSCRSVPSTSGGSSIIDKQGLITTLALRYQLLGYKWEMESMGILSRSMLVSHEIPGFSPRVFEAALAGCVLFLDDRSETLGLVEGQDYVPMSNDLEASLRRLRELLTDTAKAEEMRENAYKKLIKSGEFALEKFVRNVVSRESLNPL